MRSYTDCRDVCHELARLSRLQYAVLPFDHWWQHIDGLMQERRNSSALAMELRLSCINPSIWHHGNCSTMAQVMACCLTTSSDNYNQCWLLISEFIMWHSLGAVSQELLWNVFGIYNCISWVRYQSLLVCLECDLNWKKNPTVYPMNSGLDIYKKISTCLPD